MNGKCYIGQTVHELKRKRNHRSDARNLVNDGSFFHKAIRKYGYDSFEYTVLHSGKTKEELNVLEQVEIEKHNTLIPFGYNLKTGGMQNVKLSVESKAKMRESMTKRFKTDGYKEEHIKRMNRPEVKARISESLKNSEAFQKAILKNRDALKIKNAPRVAKNKRIKDILNLITRNERSRYRKTEEYKSIKKEQNKERVSRAQGKPHVVLSVPVFCITNETIYLSSTMAAKELLLDQGCISKIIRGDGHSTGGYYFRKATEQESKEIKARYSCS